MKVQFEETKAMLLKERDATKMVAEEAPPLKQVPVINQGMMAEQASPVEEVPLIDQGMMAEQAPLVKGASVMDQEMMGKLTAENENLKVRLAKVHKKGFSVKKRILNQREEQRPSYVRTELD